jgi:hypothetical protein
VLLAVAACDSNEIEKPINKYVGTYQFADYTIDPADALNLNPPIAGALYVDYQFSDSANLSPVRFGQFFRYMGGSILPQALYSLSLLNNGNIIATYPQTSRVTFNPKDINFLNIMMGKYKYPTADKVEAGFLTADEADVTSPEGVATWQVVDNMFRLKLNLTAITGQAPQDPASVDMGVIMEAFLQLAPTTQGQLMGWITSGIPMKIEENVAAGTVRIYLDKEMLTNLFTKQDGKNYEIKKLWDALLKAGVLPKEYSSASMLLTTIGSNWEKTTVFNIGLELKKTGK